MTQQTRKVALKPSKMNNKNYQLNQLVTGEVAKSNTFAGRISKLSFLFDWLGSANSGFHMDLLGKDENGKDKTLQFELTAGNGDGPYIPCRLNLRIRAQYRVLD